MTAASTPEVGESRNHSHEGSRLSKPAISLVGVMVVLAAGVIGCRPDPPQSASTALAPNSATRTNHSAEIPLGITAPAGWETRVPDIVRSPEATGLMQLRADLTFALEAFLRMHGRLPGSVAELRKADLLLFLPSDAQGQALPLLDGSMAQETAGIYVTSSPGTLEYQVIRDGAPVGHGRYTEASLSARVTRQQVPVPPEVDASRSLSHYLLNSPAQEAVRANCYAMIWLLRIQTFQNLYGRLPESLVEMDQLLGQTPLVSGQDDCPEESMGSPDAATFSIRLDAVQGAWELGFTLANRPYRSWQYRYTHDRQTATIHAEGAVGAEADRFTSGLCMGSWPL